MRSLTYVDAFFAYASENGALILYFIKLILRIRTTMYQIFSALIIAQNDNNNSWNKNDEWLKVINKT